MRTGVLIQSTTGRKCLSCARRRRRGSLLRQPELFHELLAVPEQPFMIHRAVLRYDSVSCCDGSVGGKDELPSGGEARVETELHSDAKERPTSSSSQPSWEPRPRVQPHVDVSRC